MMCKKLTAYALIVVMAIVPCALCVSAEGDGEEPSFPIPITPSDSSEVYAMYFADNMAFGPQWRLGNLVRIEMMVLKVLETDGVTGLTADDIPLLVNTSTKIPVSEVVELPIYDETLAYDGGAGGDLYTQSNLSLDPDLILDTYMVSVPWICVNITGPCTLDDPYGAEGMSFVFFSKFDQNVPDPDWLPSQGDLAGEVGREINKAGHLIYGFQWDTSPLLPDEDEEPAYAGIYNVSVKIPDAYPLGMSVRHLYPVTDETEETADNEAEVVEVDPIGYEVLPGVLVDEDSELIPTSGTGGVTPANEAFIFLGQLMSKSSSGTTGGGGGNGQGNCGSLSGHR